MFNPRDNFFSTGMDAQANHGISGDLYCTPDREDEIGKEVVCYVDRLYEYSGQDMYQLGVDPRRFLFSVGRHLTDEPFPVGYENRESEQAALLIASEDDC